MLRHRVAQIQPDGARPAPKPDNQQASIIVRANYFILGDISALRWSPGPHPITEAGSDLGAILQQAHHHVALVVLTTKEHCQHLDFPLLSACTKPIHGTIQSKVAKARKEIVV